MTAKKHDPELIAFLLKNVKLNSTTGALRFNNLYASVHIDICWKGTVVSVPYSHVVWLKIKKRWPQKGFCIDHKNNEAMDNRPLNLQEITETENHEKRRGRLVYRSYGTGKYGHGLHIYNDKRDNRFYVTRQLSRGHGDGDLKNVKKSLGGFDTLKQAEAAVKQYTHEIEKYGPDHMPEKIA